MANRKKRQPQYLRQEIENEIIDFNQKKVDKRRNPLTKEDFEKCGVQLNPKQEQLHDIIKNSTLTVVQGPAGTSKTFTACYAALSLFVEGKINKIILTKPIQESGESLGHLPGTIEEKVNPYFQSYLSTFEKIIGKSVIDMLKQNGNIEIQPLAYMRGSTYDNCIMLLDEAQNCTIKQMMLWVTRLGKNSKAILMGDVSQYEIKKKDVKMLDFISMVDGLDGITNFKFESTDIVRNKFLVELVDRYDKYRSEKGDNL